LAAVSHRLPDDGTAPAAVGQFGAGRMSENLHQFYTTFEKNSPGAHRSEDIFSCPSAP